MIVKQFNDNKKQKNITSTQDSIVQLKKQAAFETVQEFKRKKNI